MSLNTDVNADCRLTEGKRLKQTFKASECFFFLGISICHVPFMNVSCMKKRMLSRKETGMFKARWLWPHKSVDTAATVAFTL